MKFVKCWFVGIGVMVLLVVMVMLGGLNVVAAPLGQAQVTPTPTVSPSPTTTGIAASAADLVALASAAQAENLEWDNVSFWARGIVGDPRFERLGIGFDVGQILPAFEVPLLDADIFSLESIQEPTLVNFWATWCGPCVLELPLLLDAQADPNAPFQVVLVNVWDEADAYQEFALEELPDTMLSGRGEDDLPDRMGLQGIPSSILLDATRKIVAVHVGNITPAVMEWFYALARQDAAAPEMAESAVGIDVPPLEIPAAAPISQGLQELAVAVGRANREGGATTVWQGGILGPDSGGHLDLGFGDKMPAFGFAGADGQPFRLDLVERPTLVNFWASWCGPCIAEFPLLVERDRDPESSFQVVFVNIWDDIYTAQEFLADYPAALRSLIDTESSLANLYHLEFIPVSILVDVDGLVTLVQHGPVNEAVLQFIDALSAAG